MSRPQFVLAMLLVSLGVAGAMGAEPQKRLITDADDVIAVYRQGRGGEFPRLILAAWHDGHVVWSDDQLRGGPPYRTREVEPKVIEELFARFARDGMFSSSRLNASYHGPWEAHTSILIKNAEREVLMSSWHETVEHSGKVVAAGSGLKPVEGRSRLSILSDQFSHYLFFRAVWSETRLQLRELIADEGKEVDGELEKMAGIIVWREK